MQGVCHSEQVRGVPRRFRAPARRQQVCLCARQDHAARLHHLRCQGAHHFARDARDLLARAPRRPREPGRQHEGGRAGPAPPPLVQGAGLAARQQQEDPGAVPTDSGCAQHLHRRSWPAAVLQLHMLPGGGCPLVSWVHVLRVPGLGPWARPRVARRDPRPVGRDPRVVHGPSDGAVAARLLRRRLRPGHHAADQGLRQQ
mmetsp:Transcript_90663/g.277604  ORF Transcript_90663/g.277604 Transcript_90663/m.277604 type:complete len:200 (-) Transcript_90663:2838-3437(-)